MCPLRVKTQTHSFCPKTPTKTGGEGPCPSTKQAIISQRTHSNKHNNQAQQALVHRAHTHTHVITQGGVSKKISLLHLNGLMQRSEIDASRSYTYTYNNNDTSCAAHAPKIPKNCRFSPLAGCGRTACVDGDDDDVRPGGKKWNAHVDCDPQSTIYSPLHLQPT